MLGIVIIAHVVVQSTTSEGARSVAQSAVDRLVVYLNKDIDTGNSIRNKLLIRHSNSVAPNCHLLVYLTVLRITFQVCSRKLAAFNEKALFENSLELLHL